MAIIKSSAKPTRSISLPTRLHPDSQKIEAQLNKLKADWESPRRAPIGSEAIRSALADLVSLFDSTKELVIRSPSTQHGLEEALDGSIAVIDACGAARELLLRTRENVQSLQSSLRRKAVGSGVNAYASFRKASRREVAKRIRALKARPFPGSSSLREDHRPIVAIARELSIIAISIFRCLFAFLLSEPTRAGGGGWTAMIVSKLAPLKTSSSDEKRESEIFNNEVGNVDVSVCALQGQLRKNKGAKIEVDVVKERLEALEGCVEGLESGLESLFRGLIQHRVSLLNLLTP